MSRCHRSNIYFHLISKFVLDADIAQCFDKINHQALLTKLNTYTKLRRQIKVWLKAGVCALILKVLNSQIL